MLEQLTMKQARCKFTSLVARLILHIEGRGYEAAGDFLKRCKECPVGMETSLHKDGLAIDFNLYKDGVWLPNTGDHAEFGQYWESLHPNCSWGGRFNDGNHYSFMIDNRR